MNISSEKQVWRTIKLLRSDTRFYSNFIAFAGATQGFSYTSGSLHPLQAALRLREPLETFGRHPLNH
jgi:hypothetical protein